MGGLFSEAKPLPGHSEAQIWILFWQIWLLIKVKAHISSLSSMNLGIMYIISYVSIQSANIIYTLNYIWSIAIPS